jgi:hypothetical protein
MKEYFIKKIQQDLEEIEKDKQNVEENMKQS